MESNVNSETQDSGLFSALLPGLFHSEPPAPCLEANSKHFVSQVVLVSVVCTRSRKPLYLIFQKILPSFKHQAPSHNNPISGFS